MDFLSDIVHHMEKNMLNVVLGDVGDLFTVLSFMLMVSPPVQHLLKFQHNR